MKMSMWKLLDISDCLIALYFANKQHILILWFYHYIAMCNILFSERVRVDSFLCWQLSVTILPVSFHEFQ